MRSTGGRARPTAPLAARGRRRRSWWTRPDSSVRRSPASKPTWSGSGWSRCTCTTTPVRARALAHPFTRARGSATRAPLRKPQDDWQTLVPSCDFIDDALAVLAHHDRERTGERGDPSVEPLVQVLFNDQSSRACAYALKDGSCEADPMRGRHGWARAIQVSDGSGARGRKIEYRVQEVSRRGASAALDQPERRFPPVASLALCIPSTQALRTGLGSLSTRASGMSRSFALRWERRPLLAPASNGSSSTSRWPSPTRGCAPRTYRASSCDISAPTHPRTD